jgi:alkylhydroperoxidase/carboxymuconolactone decarboxylase family protein YurZ
MLVLDTPGNLLPNGRCARRRRQVKYEPVAFDEYKQQLRRLAMHDDALLEEIAVTSSSFEAAVIDERTQALARVAATIAVGAASASFQHVVTHALAVGATVDEIVATLEAVTPVTGAARVVQCAPKVALALGYDVDAALEQLDP